MPSRKCPECGSFNTKEMQLPMGSEVFIFCEDCKKVSSESIIKITKDFLPGKRR